MERILDALEAYECWEPYFRLVRTLISEGRASVSHFVRLARAQLKYLEDVFAASETSAQLVRQHRLGYVDFQEQFLKIVVDQDDWATEGVILQSCINDFTQKKDSVAALERLCLIYEKKTHNEDALSQAFQKLLAVDTQNEKALKHFKLVKSQAGNWIEVTTILKSLIEASSHNQNRYRYAQELAAVFLYQLDMPQEAIKIIDQYCVDSHLDTSTIHYDACQRLGDWQGCLRVLARCLAVVQGQESKAILHYKSGVLRSHLNQEAEALEHLESAIALWPRFLAPIEKAIGIYLKQENWTKVLSLLNRLSDQLFSENLLASIQDVTNRLKEGLGATEAE